MTLVAISGAIAYSQWRSRVEAARSRKLPLGAGASNTTQVLMKFAAQVKMPPNEKSALAWAAFSFWNSEFKQVQATRRLLFAKRLLSETALPITDVAAASGAEPT